MDNSGDKLVSIVIPVYNRSNLINETIKSAINQTYKNIEIIIVDNKSTDDTFDIISNAAAKYPKLKVFQNDSNIGPVRNWKVCFDNASGDYIKILWSDDLIAETFVEDAIKKMNEDVAFVISEIKTFDSDSNEVLKLHSYGHTGIYPVKKYLNDIIMFNKSDYPTSPGCAIFRAKDLRNALVLDVPNTDNLDFKKHGAGNDLLLFLITAVNYKNIEILPYAGSHYRDHKQSLSILYAKEIFIFHEWAKCFFVKNYYPVMADQFKAKIFLKNIISKRFKNIYKYSIGDLNLLNIMVTLFKRITSKSS